MTQRQLKKKYQDLIAKANLAVGRKDTVSYLKKANKLQLKIIDKSKHTCSACNGIGYLRSSLEVTKTCMHCFGKGYRLKETDSSR